MAGSNSSQTNSKLNFFQRDPNLKIVIPDKSTRSRPGTPKTRFPSIADFELRISHPCIGVKKETTMNPKSRREYKRPHCQRHSFRLLQSSSVRGMSSLRCRSESRISVRRLLEFRLLVYPMVRMGSWCWKTFFTQQKVLMNWES